MPQAMAGQVGRWTRVAKVGVVLAVSQALLWGGATQAAEEDDTPPLAVTIEVARMGAQAFTAMDVIEYAKKNPLFLSHMNYRDGFYRIVDDLLLGKALEQDLQGTPRARQEKESYGALIFRESSAATRSCVDLDDDGVRQAFERNPDRFGLPMQVRFRRAFFPDGSVLHGKAPTDALIDWVAAHAGSDARTAFAALESESRALATPGDVVGLMGFVAVAQDAPDYGYFRDSEIGSVLGPFKVDGGVAVLQLEDRRLPPTPRWDDVQPYAREEAVRQCKEERMAALRTALFARQQVVVNPDAFAQMIEQNSTPSQSE